MHVNNNMFDDPEGFKVDQSIDLMRAYIKSLEKKVKDLESENNKLEESNNELREFIRMRVPQYNRFA